MKRFIEGEDRNQSTLFPECLDDYIAEDNPVRVVDVFVDELDLGQLGFCSVNPKVTGRPACHPSTLLKLYISAYLNRVQSSRRLEREAQRNVELTWLTERLSPGHKTISDFRKDNSKAIGGVCREFVVLCRRLNLFTQTLVVIDGSKFKAVNNLDRSFTRARMKCCLAQIEASLDHYFEQLERVDHEESGKRYRYWCRHCEACSLKSQCTTGKERRVTRWEHEAILEAMQDRLDRDPEIMRVRRQKVEHPYGTLKAWMGSMHFLTRTLNRVGAGMSLHVRRQLTCPVRRQLS